MTVQQAAITANRPDDDFINIDGFLQLVPGMTRGNAAQLRYNGRGPRFYKPSARVVLYKQHEVLEWLNSTGMTKTSRKEEA